MRWTRAAAVAAMAAGAVALGAVATAGGDHDGDLDCSDFSTQAAAQQHMNAHPGDPDGLDGNDGDGRACESNPCPCDYSTGTDGGETERRTARRYRGRVVSVTDGDTLRVRLRSAGRRTVRLIGIDTPETRKPGVQVECGGREATRRMKRLALRGGRGVRVRLTTDPTQDRSDRYGRLLAYVNRLSDRRDLGRAMVRAGWAAVYVYGGRPFRRLPAYSRAHEKAQAAGRGVFGKCGGDFHSGQ